jgi:hypothetical protein
MATVVLLLINLLIGGLGIESSIEQRCSDEGFIGMCV